MEAGTLSWVDFEAAARYWAESSSRVGATLAGQRLSWVWDWEWRAAGAQGVLPGQGFLALRPVARRVLLQGRCTPEAEDKYEQRPAEEQQAFNRLVSLLVSQSVSQLVNWVHLRCSAINMFNETYGTYGDE